MPVYSILDQSGKQTKSMMCDLLKFSITNRLEIATMATCVWKY